MSIAIGYILSQFALRPIVSIQDTASRISSKTLNERINVPSTGDEVARLAEFLNTMFDRLESSFAQVQRFTADVSHELNTPLSLIRLHAEELLNKPNTENEKRSQILTNQIELVDSLNKVVKDLLILAKADAGVLNLSLNKLNTHTLIEDFAQDASVCVKTKVLLSNSENKFRGSIFCDSTWMRHLLFNLLKRAMRFSPQGCTIRIISEKENSDWKISFIDQGPGITADKLGRVFERFYNEQDPQGGRAPDSGFHSAEASPNFTEALLPIQSIERNGTRRHSPTTTPSECLAPRRFRQCSHRNRFHGFDQLDPEILKKPANYGGSTGLFSLPPLLLRSHG